MQRRLHLSVSETRRSRATRPNRSMRSGTRGRSAGTEPLVLILGKPRCTTGFARTGVGTDVVFMYSFMPLCVRRARTAILHGHRRSFVLAAFSCGRLQPPLKSVTAKVNYRHAPSSHPKSLVFTTPKDRIYIPFDSISHNSFQTSTQDPRKETQIFLSSFKHLSIVQRLSRLETREIAQRFELLEKTSPKPCIPVTRL